MGETTTRTRALKSSGELSGYSSGERRQKSDGRWVDNPAFDARGTDPGFSGAEVTQSESHEWPPKGGFHDVGGEFLNTKAKVKFNKVTINLGQEFPLTTTLYDKARIRGFAEYRCPVTMNGQKIALPSSLKSSDNTLDAWGAKAVSLCRPTAAEVDLSTALGELFREGLPAVTGARTWQERTLRARNAGDEYLNVEFGWAPLVSDVQGFGRTLARSHEIVSQYERDRGRLVRRRFNFPTIKTDPVTTSTSNVAPIGASQAVKTGPQALLSSNGVLFRTESSTVDRWFSGAFVYGSPLRSNAVGSSASLAEKADKLFNLSLSPDVLWNLTPWSWATDWAFNTGDILSYAGDVASQGLVMAYGYCMEHTVHTYEYKLVGATRYGQPVEPSAEISFETKRRRIANPFGFGVTWSGLSSAQASILAALGISRR